MLQLINGGSGHVNMYLNDLHSLKRTFLFFAQTYLHHSSRISSNSMSYGPYSASFKSGFSLNSQSGESEF